MIAGPFRLGYQECLSLLRERLSENAPARIQLLSGPRQVGKTTLLLELARDLGEKAIYVSADGPEATLPAFWERIWVRAEELATAYDRVVVMLDEVHLLDGWASHLKAEWDRVRRKHLPIHVVATGSSSLRIGADSRESLAGRFEKLTLAHWSASSLAGAFGLTPEEAVDQFVRLGSYPGAMSFRKDLPRFLAYIRDAIIEPAIGRDLLVLAPVRKPALLRQVFGMCVSSPAQIVSLQKIQGQLQSKGALETIAHYLALLEEAFLVAAVGKYSSQPARRRASPPKLIVLNNALIAATEPREIPDSKLDPARFGVWVENACLARAWNAGQAVSYWREEPFEVDAILEGSWGRWAVEVKTGSFGVADLRGVLEFNRRFPAFRPLVLCEAALLPVVKRAGIEGMEWRRFLTRQSPSILRATDL